MKGVQAIHLMQLLLNTETNGRVDTSGTEIVEFPKLRSSLWWTVTAQETGWLIEQLDTRFSRTFNYHPSHQLSDVSTIEIHDEEGCGVDTGFNVLLKFREEVRMVEYSKVTAQASCFSSGGINEQNSIFFHIGNGDSVGIIVNNEKNILELYRYGRRQIESTSTVLTDPVTEDTNVTVVLEHIDGVRYQASGTVGDDTVNYLVTGTVTGNLIMLITNFSNIQKIEIE